MSLLLALIFGGGECYRFDYNNILLIFFNRTMSDFTASFIIWEYLLHRHNRKGEQSTLKYSEVRIWRENLYSLFSLSGHTTVHWQNKKPVKIECAPLGMGDPCTVRKAQLFRASLGSPVHFLFIPIESWQSFTFRMCMLALFGIKLI